MKSLRNGVVYFSIFFSFAIVKCRYNEHINLLLIDFIKVKIKHYII